MILKNGYVINDNKLEKKDILIKGKYISLIEDEINDELEEVIDCKDLLIMPGAVDVHVHFREPGNTKKETIKTGSMSAAKGGFTTVLAMPNLNPCPDSLENLQVEEEIIKKDAVIDVYPYASLSKNEEGKIMSDLETLCEKVYAISDDGVGVNNEEVLKEAMLVCKEHNKIIASHAEDLVDSKLPRGEYIAVRREIKLAKETGVRYHFCHLSTKESFEAIREAKKEGFKNISCEVTPHHLFLNERQIKDANYKMNPPLRSIDNMLETQRALLDKTALIIASDHAPHTEEEKKRPYEEAPNGIIGLETLLPLVYTNLIKNERASLNDFLDWVVFNPIKIFSLPKRKLSPGYLADLCMLDINHKRPYLESEILSKGHNSPFIGMELYGFNKRTIKAGKIIWEER